MWHPAAHSQRATPITDAPAGAVQYKRNTTHAKTTKIQNFC